jgi:hypothetical protein
MVSGYCLVRVSLSFVVLKRGGVFHPGAFPRVVIAGRGLKPEKNSIFELNQSGTNRVGVFRFTSTSVNEAVAAVQYHPIRSICGYDA